MEHDETGCQPPPEGPILCINNCGFFGSAANMNMCSKCYKDLGMVVVGPVDVQPDSIDAKSIALSSSQTSSSSDVAVKAKVGPNRCGTCKRVGISLDSNVAADQIHVPPSLHFSIFILGTGVWKIHAHWSEVNNGEMIYWLCYLFMVAAEASLAVEMG
ncbi:Candidapepsin-3 [Datura stramonium]|uniref:Candidapepsin-3 n=1 Tax=Datura stramonium TaxID=4076 RepID=A0ABS8WM48_DATST|nr:Candidapepsin-3 [Datura stramonium]